MILFEHVVHPWSEQRKTQGPVKVADQHPADSRYARFNRAFAVWATRVVGTMTCAYLFAALAFSSLPQTISTHSVVQIVQWIAQTFFQLVLLSVILVGQNVQGQASDARAQSTFNDAEVILHNLEQAAQHLGAQDGVASEIVDLISALHTRLDSMERRAGLLPGQEPEATP